VQEESRAGLAPRGLLRGLGARDAAADAYARALELAGNGAERALLARRLGETRP